MGSRICTSVVWVLLLVGPALFGGLVGAQSSPPAVNVVAVERVGDNVTVEAGSDLVLQNVVASLLSSNVLVALPEHEVSYWGTAGTKKFTFALLKDVETATFRVRWRDGDNRETQDIGILVPKKPEPPVEENRTAHLIVETAHLVDATLTVNLTNVGDATALRALVSLENGAARKIGSPYYRVVDGLRPGASASVAFVVARDLEHVVVAVAYDNRTERSDLLVTRATAGEGQIGADAGAPNVTLATDLPFREVDIGRTVDFSLDVANTGGLALVQISASGLPAGYSARFFVGGSSVPSLYLDTNQSRVVTLSITIPNSESEVDRTIDFRTIAMVNGTVLADLPMGLAVRGVGKLALSGETLFERVPPGGTGRFAVTVTNEGSAPLFDVDLDGRNRPYGWTIRFEPRRLDRLDPGESKVVSVEVRAPDVIGPGRYVTDVAAQSGDASSRPLSFAVEVEQGETSGGWLWIVFLAIIVGILGWAGWKKRRG